MRTTLGLCMLASAGCAGHDSTAEAWALPSATTLSAPVLVASPDPVVLVYGDSFSLNPQARGRQVDTAVWGDGRIVWRADGALLEARIDTKQIDALLRRLHDEGVFGDGHVRYDAFGPDSGFDVVEVRLADRDLRLRSWHEGFEQNARLVGTAHGIEVLDGRDRETVLAAQPEEYRRFRRIWSEIVAVRSWVPKTGEPFTGQIRLDRDG